MRVAASLLLLAVILPALAGAAWSACLRSGIRRVRRAHRGGLAAALDIFTTSEWNPAISKPFHIRPGRLAGGRLPACKGRFTAPDPEG